MNLSPFRIHSIALLLLLMAACGGDNSNEVSRPDAGKATLIATETVNVMNLPIWLHTVGTVRSVSAPTLAAEVDGRVTMVYADTGDSIEVGQLLAETDT